MADNILVTPSSDPTAIAVAGDVVTVSGQAALYQRIKNCFGDDGSAVDVSDTNPLPVYNKASESHLGEIGGKTIIIPAAFTRPSDTTAYAALDAVSNSTSAPTVITFTNAARIAQGNGYITGAEIWTDQVTNVARFRLHIFHTAPTALNDNAPYTLLWANRTKKVGYIDFDAASTEGTGSDCARSLNTSIRLPFNCASGDRNLYGLLETRDAFTPTNAQNFYCDLRIEQN